MVFHNASIPGKGSGNNSNNNNNNNKSFLIYCCSFYTTNQLNKVLGCSETFNSFVLFSQNNFLAMVWSNPLLKYFKHGPDIFHIIS